MHDRSRLLLAVDCDPERLIRCPVIIPAVAFLPDLAAKAIQPGNTAQSEPSRVLVLNKARAKAI